MPGRWSLRLLFKRRQNGDQKQSETWSHGPQQERRGTHSPFCPWIGGSPPTYARAVYSARVRASIGDHVIVSILRSRALYTNVHNKLITHQCCQQNEKLTLSLRCDDCHHHLPEEHTPQTCLYIVMFNSLTSWHTDGEALLYVMKHKKVPTYFCLPTE